MSDIVIGIDLGTTNSCVGVYYDNKLKILENAKGKKTTPSVVYFDKVKGPIVGEYAKTRSMVTPELGVSAIKRLIGRQKNDVSVKAMLKYFSFKLLPHSEEATIVIEHNDFSIIKDPSSISALILLQLKEDVEEKLGHEIDKAVITVPAYFNVSQREATMKAAEKAGLEVVKLLSEPTAAALSYYYYKKCNKLHYSKEHHSLVFDLGGGTFDVAIIKKSGEDFEVVGVDGDSFLGGQDFDQEIFDFVSAEVSRLYNFNVLNDRRLTRRLLVLCEDAKKELSNLNEAKITFQHPTTDNEIEILLTRKQFEDIIEPHIKKTIRIVDNCLKTSKLSKDNVAEIILAGGSTRIPKIQEALSNYFNNRQLNKLVNPDECVAEGAAIQAALLSKNTNQQFESTQITEVTPFSLGIDCLCDVMSFIIPRNSKIPITKSSVFENVYDQQSSMKFSIYEGERLNVKKNRYLTNLTINNLTPAPPEQCKVDLKMSIDNNGVLTVTAQEKFKNNIKDLKITYTRVANNENDGRHEILSNEKYEEEDKKFEIFAEKKKLLIKYCVDFCYQIKQKNLIEKHKELITLCENTRKEADLLNVEGEKKVEELTKSIKNKCDAILAGIKSDSIK